MWTVGLAADARHAYDAIDFTVPSAIVLGAEGEGLRRLVRERCDFLASHSDERPRGEPERLGGGRRRTCSKPSGSGDAGSQQVSEMA